MKHHFIYYIHPEGGPCVPGAPVGPAGPLCPFCPFCPIGGDPVGPGLPVHSQEPANAPSCPLFPPAKLL